MNPIIRNILAVVVGVVVGGAANMAIIIYGGSLIPAPEGVNPMDAESIKENIDLFEFKHFVMPFLAHAIGTLVGAFLAGLIAATHKSKFAVGIAVWFLIGGVANCFMIPAPTWFIIADLALAYIPMGLFAAKLTDK